MIHQYSVAPDFRQLRSFVFRGPVWPDKKMNSSELLQGLLQKSRIIKTFNLSSVQ